MSSIVIIGAGPAGLSSSHELVRCGIHPVLLEKANMVGGIARTESYKGYLFDVGGHRFFTKNKEIEKLWQEMLGENLINVSRLSRIYYHGRFFNYPLSFYNALSNLGFWESLLILLSYMSSRVRPYRQEDTFEQWVSNRFGERLYRTFFKTYTEKVWGIPCSEIRAEWAVQRIKGLSLLVAVSNALLNLQRAKSLISEFHYPLRGPGMMWESFREFIEAGGGQIHLNAEAGRVVHENGRILHVEYVERNNRLEAPVSHVISSMPITKLVSIFYPKPPKEVLNASRLLRYRALVMVWLVVAKKELFPDQWIYVHSPHVRVGRIQNSKNWSAAMVPYPDKTSIGMEYFCSEGDELWNLPNEDLVAMATKELGELGLCATEDVEDKFVIRQPMAYPVYDEDYREGLRVIRTYLERFGNLYTIGRNGMHRYNNIDHSMLTGILAAQNVLGATNDLWEVNEEESYLEEDESSKVEWFILKKLFKRTFARMDKLAFATAIGSVSGLTILLATLWLVVKGGDIVGPNMSLLNQYFSGYSVTVKGAFIGFGYSFFWGFLFGWFFAYVRNLFIALYIYRIKKKVENFTIRDFLDGF